MGAPAARGRADPPRASATRRSTAAYEAVRLAPELSVTTSTLAHALHGRRRARGGASTRPAAPSCSTPTTPTPTPTLGDVLASRRETRPEALAAYRTALAIDPENTSRSTTSRSRASAVHENDRGAAGQFEKALQLDPTDSVARRNLLHPGYAGDVYACRRVDVVAARSRRS